MNPMGDLDIKTLKNKALSFYWRYIGQMFKNPSEVTKPTFLIIGVQKAGTTTLYDLLNNTNIFKGALQKEVNFFNRDVNYQEGINWYFDFFKDAKKKITFEASPSYMYARNVPKRIRDTLGSMKFIVVLREPVTRCFSAWNMFRSFNKNPVMAEAIYETFVQYANVEHRAYMYDLLFTKDFPSFEECVDRDIYMHKTASFVEEPSFVRRGLYYEQIMRYLEYFSLEDFLFLEQSELTDVRGTLSKIQKFLGLKMDISLNDVAMQIVSNKGYYEDVDIQAYRNTFLKLHNFYRDHNVKLFQLIGKKYTWNLD